MKRREFIGVAACLAAAPAIGMSGETDSAPPSTPIFPLLSYHVSGKKLFVYGASGLIADFAKEFHEKMGRSISNPMMGILDCIIDAHLREIGYMPFHVRNNSEVAAAVHAACCSPRRDSLELAFAWDKHHPKCGGDGITIGGKPREVLNFWHPLMVATGLDVKSVDEWCREMEAAASRDGLLVINEAWYPNVLLHKVLSLIQCDYSFPPEAA